MKRVSVQIIIRYNQINLLIFFPNIFFTIDRIICYFFDFFNIICYLFTHPQKKLCLLACFLFFLKILFFILTFIFTFFYLFVVVFIY